MIRILNVDNGDSYRFNEEYAPELNPIERGFSMIRIWIRRNANLYVGNPIGLINAAFTAYSDGGEMGSNCYHLFDLYRRNHIEWLNSLYI